jgi:hypothetical protein
MRCMALLALMVCALGVAACGDAGGQKATAAFVQSTLAKKLGKQVTCEQRTNVKFRCFARDDLGNIDELAVTADSSEGSVAYRKIP